MRWLCTAAVLLALGLPSVAAAKTVRIDRHSNGRSVTIHRGDVLLLVLADPSRDGGYEWDVTHVARAVLHPRGSKFVPSGPGIGAGGTDYDRFGGAKTGWTELRMTYRRPFDVKHPIGSFRVRVTVK